MWEMCAIEANQRWLNKVTLSGDTARFTSGFTISHGPTETVFPLLDARFTTLFVSPEILRPLAQSRASVTAPIAPSASPSDVDLFESPADATVRFHLPRLRIRTDATSYDLRLTPEDGGWSIRFGSRSPGRACSTSGPSSTAPRR